MLNRLQHTTTSKSIFLVLYFASKFGKVLSSVAPVHSRFHSSGINHWKEDTCNLFLLSASFHVSKPNTAAAQHFQRNQMSVLFSILLPLRNSHFCFLTWHKSFNNLIIYHAKHKKSIQNKILLSFLGLQHKPPHKIKV